MSTTFERDKSDLNRAGVSLDELVSAAADFVRHQPLYRIKVVGNALTTQEEKFLKRAGASGVGDGFNQEAYRDTLKDSALEYGKMIASSWGQSRVAKFLGVSTSRIRQRSDAKTLYSLNTPKGRVYPSWQFTENGKTVPGIDEIFPLLRDDAHPIGIQRFFLIPQCDLEDEVCGKIAQFSPVNWLVSGHSVADVKRLAEHI